MNVPDTFMRLRQYMRSLGPGLITGAADDDPSGIATYSQTGSMFGFQLLWMSILTFPLMGIVQEMCARIGIVTGKGLAANIRIHHSRFALVSVCILLFAANTFNIAADLAAMAAATQLILPIQGVFLVAGFAVFCVACEIYFPYATYVRFLKFLTLALFSYVATAFAVSIDWYQVLTSALAPHFNFTQAHIVMICALLGTTISPYLFFWQTAQEVEELHVAQRTNHLNHSAFVNTSLSKMRTDVWTGMFFSNLVMFFIITTCAATLYSNGITTITSAADAALALRPFGGAFTYYLFAFGIVGTGLLAIPVLAGSSAYALSEAFGWKRGLDNTFTQARAFYGVIIFSALLGVLAYFFHIDPIQSLIYSAVFNGLVAPIVLYFIVSLSSTLPSHANSRSTTLLGWGITSIMTLAACATLYTLFI
jgi:NRAMP (natural resistance-associated macrophage protein)-like metal ion transporter